LFPPLVKGFWKQGVPGKNGTAAQQIVVIKPISQRFDKNGKRNLDLPWRMQATESHPVCPTLKKRFTN